MKLFNQKIPKNILILGIASFFNDIASEMTYPLIPLFLSNTLHSSPLIIGYIEGISELTSNTFKIISGWMSDKIQKRKIFITSGYILTSIAKTIIGSAFNWKLALMGRFVDRLGKGIRTAPKNALIVESSNKKKIGLSFGFDKALDSTGAVIGPLISLILLISGINLRKIFFAAFIPGLVSIILISLFIKELKPFKKEKYFFNKVFNSRYKNFLYVSILFYIGNSPNTFLILRAGNLGLTITNIIFAYTLYNSAYALSSIPIGIISDKIGERVIIAAGFFLFNIVYLFIGIINHTAYMWIFFPVLGLYTSLINNSSKAYISKITEKKSRGAAFGLYQSLMGFCKFFASITAGFLWNNISAGAPFIFGSATSLIALILLAFQGFKY